MKALILTLTSTNLTSDVELTDTADTVTGSIFADQPGTLHVEQSGDGTNFDIDDAVAVTANTGAKINVTILLPYVRLRWVATGAQATVFRVFARLASSGVKP